MKIKTIMFDWGGVCVKGKLAEKVGKKIGPRMKKSPKSVTIAYLKYCWEYQTGRITAKEFWKRVQEDLGTSLTREELIKSHVTARELNKGVIELIKKLKTNYKVMLVTNTYKEYYEHSNKRYKIDKIFDDIVLSYKIKGRKPEPKVYREALRRARCRPEEVVFIEDKNKHLIPARKLGMRTILYKNQTDLKQRLKKIGVRW